MSYGSNYSRHEEEEEAVDAINQQKLILTNPKTLQTPTNTVLTVSLPQSSSRNQQNTFGGLTTELFGPRPVAD